MYDQYDHSYLSEVIWSQVSPSGLGKLRGGFWIWDRVRPVFPRGDTDRTMRVAVPLPTVGLGGRYWWIAASVGAAGSDAVL